jgi:lysozyme
MVSLDQVTAILAKHEGFRATAYKDTRGFLTIGYGTNLDAVGAQNQCAMAGFNYLAVRDGAPITQSQALSLLQKAARHAMDCASIRVNGYADMPANVQLAVVDMVYNLGFAGFCEFRNMIAALEANKWSDAVQEMRCSAWFHQVGQRALDDISLVESANEVSIA